MQFRLQALFRGKSKITNESLKKWNVVLAALLALQGVAILLFSTSHVLPVTVSFLTSNSIQTQITGQTVTALGMQQLFAINLVYLVAAFLFIAAITNLLLATVYRKQYDAALKKYKNPIRWIEYAFVFGIITIIISMIVGVYDLSSLLLLFCLAVIMSISGLVIEGQNTLSKRKSLIRSWPSVVVGIVAAIAQWLIIALYISATDIFGSSQTSVFVYITFVSMLAILIGIVLNMYLQYKKSGKWANYLYGECWYMALSFIVMTVLTWEIFAGYLHP